MLEELRQPERKATLKKPGRPPTKQLPQLQIDSKSNVNSTRQVPPYKALPENNTMSRNELPPTPVPFPKPRTTSNSPGTTSTISNNNPIPSPRPLKPLPNFQADNIISEDDVGGQYEYIDRKILSEYQKICISPEENYHCFSIFPA